ncbi:ATP-binding cassette domain-containing protein, partial [Agrococcus casei]
MSAVLSITDLSIEFGPKGSGRTVVDSVSLDLTAGRIQGLAGESGSGKTVTAMAVLGLLPDSAKVTGSIRLGDTELLGMPTRQLRSIRGMRVAMVFQDPSASLHPQITVGSQLTDHVRHHLKLKR